MSAGLRDPNELPKLLHVAAVGFDGSWQVTVCPGLPVKRYPETTEKAALRGLVIFRAMMFTPCAPVSPSLKYTVPLIVPYAELVIVFPLVADVTGYRCEIHAISSGA